MKHVLYLIALSLLTLLSAQGAEEELPPEPSEPPFEVGALPLKSGYTIEREDAPNLNFRIVDSKMRLYWLDEDGLIMEPEVSGVTVRFTGSVRGRSYHRLTPVGGDVALGSQYNLLSPNLYNITLVLAGSNAEEKEVFRFRYTPSMNAVLEPDS